MSALRIALYHNLHSGGAKRVAAEEVKRLARRHHVSVFTLTSADTAFAEQGAAPEAATVTLPYRAVRMAGRPFGRINPVLGLVNIGRMARLARQTAALIDRSGFDLVLVHPCQLTQAPLMLRWTRTPSVYYCHELPRHLYEPPIRGTAEEDGRWRARLDRVDPFYRGIRVVLKQLDQTNAGRAGRIVTNSRFTQRNIAAAYQRAAEVCYPGVEPGDFGPAARTREGFVLSVGAITPAKGFSFVILALAALPAAQRPPLVIVGNYQEQGERDRLQRLAGTLDVTLHCHVGVSEAELRDWYARAGCVAYAPIREPFGLVALEAMAAGAPLVAVAEGGLTETVVEGVTGRLLPRDPRLFAQAIGGLLNDPRAAQRLGQAARQHVREQWTWDRHVTQLEALLGQPALQPA